MKKAILVFPLLAVLLSGCFVDFESLPTRDFPFEMMLQQTDLPKQYAQIVSEYPEVENGTSYRVSYENRSIFPGSNITHWLTIFQDTSSAQKFYKSRKDHFLRNYYLPDELTFTPANTTDIYEIGCIDGSTNDIPTMSCKLIQIHENIVIQVSTSTDMVNLDIITFNEILQVLDSRLPVSDPTPTP